jgi:hypothetical protein
MNIEGQYDKWVTIDCWLQIDTYQYPITIAYYHVVQFKKSNFNILFLDNLTQNIWMSFANGGAFTRLHAYAKKNPKCDFHA